MLGSDGRREQYPGAPVDPAERRAWARRRAMLLESAGGETLFRHLMVFGSGDPAHVAEARKRRDQWVRVHRSE